MKINGGVSFIENGITASIRQMQVDAQLISNANENVTGFDKIGYQRKDTIVSSMTEFLGINGISQTVDDKVGRIALSENPLDIALATKGYFQTESKDGIKITRDGRFKLDKNGNLLTLDDSKVLSNTGMAIKLPFVPNDLKQIHVNNRGLISVMNQTTGKFEKVAYLGVVDTNGALVMDPQVKQGYNEYSNVSLQEEFINMMPVIKNFDANRQLFMIQNSNLQKVISQLGTTS